MDGLRAIAIFLVLLEHFACGRRFYSGFFGVELFFVISGFLITGILLKVPTEEHPSKSYFNFLIRRILRIFPIYYATILVMWLAQLPIVRTYILSFLTFTFNIVLANEDTQNSPMNHVWSLCVEEQFYLFWPWLVLLWRRRIATLFAIAVFFVIVGNLQLEYSIFPYLTKYNFVGILTKMAPLSLGAIGAICIHADFKFHDILNTKLMEYLSLLVIAIVLLSSVPFMALILGLMSLFWVLKASYLGIRVGVFRTLLTHPWVVHYGVISYGVYLFHLPLVYYFNIYFGPYLRPFLTPIYNSSPLLSDKTWIVTFPIYFIIYTLFSLASYHWFEKRFILLKDKFRI